MCGALKWLLAILALPAVAQTCLDSGEVPTLSGRLKRSEAAGNWTLRLDHPACIGARPLRHAKDFRVVADQDSEGTTYWLGHLSGERVLITGQIETGMATEGSSPPLITARWVEPAKGTGNRSYIPWGETRILLTPRPIRGVTPRSYEVLALTGKSLVLEAREIDARRFLKPARDYVTYWTDSTRELWIGCGDGYRFTGGRFAPAVSGDCDGTQCYFSRPLEETAALTMRCVREP